LFTKQKAEDLGTVKLTLQKFYRINGGATQLKGVTPDIVLPDRYDYLKIREKDNSYALPWDEISKAEYHAFGTAGIDNIVNAAKEDISRSDVFNKIKTNTTWLEKYNDRDYSLLLNNYRADLKKIKSVNKEFDELYKLPKPMEIRNLVSDTATINSATDKMEKNKQWLKVRSSDIFIDAAVKVLDKMITLQNTAKKD
jgi:carboxyl-terminal processing protease